MDWYYSLNNERQGPVSADKLAEIVRQGVVTNATLVWHQGMKDWAPYSLASSGPVAAGQRRCGECGKVLPESDMIEYNKVWICAACKPLFIQRLQEGIAPASRMVWRSGKRLIMNKDAVLPERCVKCNAPAEDGKVTRQLYWIPPAYYLLILLSLIIFIIVAIIVQKKAKITYCLCETHRAKRRLGIWITSALFAGGLLLCILAAVYSNGMMVAIGLLLLLISLIYGLIATRTVFAAKIDKDIITLGGAGPEFLAEFPEWTGQG